MKISKTIVSIFSLLLALQSLPAQTLIPISGTVKDALGYPVSGAVVMVEGSKPAIAAVTDLDGRYSLKMPSSASALVAQCLGYADATLAADMARTIYDFVLSDDSEMLEKVVVVGYGSMRESDITGSVSQVKIKDEDAMKSLSVDQMLKGRTAGVQVQTSSGAPGAGINIKIRGNSSFNGGGEPLYVVDGIIINSSNSNVSVLSQSGLEEEETSGLLGINPQDIASMEILKDASATAIYGALGANGVILITTRTANREKPQITFSSGLDVSRRAKTMQMLSLSEYCDYLTAKNYTTGLNNILVEPTDPSQGFKVDEVRWQDYMMRTAVNQRYYLSVARKSKGSSYMFSASWKDTQGILKNTGLNQFSSRLNMDQKLTDRFSVALKLNVSRIDSDMLQGASSGGMTSSTSAIRSMLNARPYYNFDDDDDEAAGLTEDNGARPDRWLRDFVSRREEYRVIPNISAEYRFNKWLRYKLSAGGDLRVKKSIKWKGPFVTHTTDWALAGMGTNQSMLYNIDNMLEFDRKFKKHRLSGTVGTTFNSSNTITQVNQGWNIEQYFAQYHNINSAPVTSTSFVYGESAAATLSVLARLVWNYKDRYVLTSTFRRDGSSRFSKENRYSNFPSFAFAWKINDESWFKLRPVSVLKLRLGWGRVGNQALASYQTLSNYSSVWYPDHSEGNANSGIIGLVPSNLANPSLKWETTEQTNIGLDLKLLDDRISFTADAYDKKTFDLLQDIKVPVTTGFSQMWMNLGTIGNRGIEFSMDADIIRSRNLKWNVFGNISHNENRIVSIGLPSADGGKPYFYGKAMGTANYCKTPVNLFMEGQPMGLFFGIKTLGIVQEGETGPGLSLGETVGPGSVRYDDISGDGFIDDADRQIIGDPNPDLTFGFGTSVSWKRLSVDIQFEGVYGNEIANINLIQENDISHNTMNIRKDAFLKAWTPQNTATDYPAIGCYDMAENKFFTSRCVEDGSYLRLASVSLVYDIPLSEKIGFIEGASVSLGANNLLLFTKYSGWDPDVNVFGSNMMRMGVDYGSYPKARSISFDIKLRF